MCVPLPLYQAGEEVSKYLQQIKGMLYGDGGALSTFPFGLLYR